MISYQFKKKIPSLWYGHLTQDSMMTCLLYIGKLKTVSSVEKSSVSLQCVSQIISCKDFFFLSRAQLFKAGFGPAESLQGGLCLLASVQVLTGCIKGVVRSLSLSHKHTYRQTDIHTHTEAN